MNKTKKNYRKIGRQVRKLDREYRKKPTKKLGQKLDDAIDRLADLAQIKDF